MFNQATTFCFNESEFLSYLIANPSKVVVNALASHRCSITATDNGFMSLAWTRRFSPGTSASFHTNDPLALTHVSMRDVNKSCKINKVQFSKSPKENVSKLNSSGKKPPLILVYKEEMQLISQNFHRYFRL